MPFGVKKSGSGAVVYRRDTGAIKSHHANAAKARSAIRAIYANDPKLRHESAIHKKRR